MNDSDAESNGYMWVFGHVSTATAGSRGLLSSFLFFFSGFCSIVVPGEEANQSGASTPSSHNYVNVPEKKGDRFVPCSDFYFESLRTPDAIDYWSTLMISHVRVETQLVFVSFLLR